MSVKLRFAPSPTGYIHVGNIRTALMNWLYARKNDGHFLLRLDDTDQERSTEEYAQAIQDDLNWLGLNFDSIMTQSSRMNRYNEIKQHLIDIGRLYPAYETPDELDRKRKRQLAKRLPPVYDRAALALTNDDKAKLESDGQKPHWRFKLNQSHVKFSDMIRGDVNIDCASVSDPVLIREDGTFLYTLCSVIDDIDTEITHIIRGEDHVTNTAVQVQIFEALGKTPPIFGHHPLLMDENGEKLSKRLGSLSIRGLKENGIEPLTILSYLSRIGTSAPVEACSTYQILMNGFDINIVTNTPARFVAHDMENLNAHILRDYPFEKIKPRLLELDIINVDEHFWNGVKANIKHFNDIKVWTQVVSDTIEPIIDNEDKDYIALAASLLPNNSWNELTWNEWINAIKQKTDRKGKTLFMPLRKALTAMEHGPEMNIVLPLIGYEKAKKRLMN